MFEAIIQAAGNTAFAIAAMGKTAVESLWEYLKDHR